MVSETPDSVMENWAPKGYVVYPLPNKPPRADPRAHDAVQAAKRAAFDAKGLPAEQFEKAERALFFERAKSLLLDVYASHPPIRLFSTKEVVDGKGVPQGFRCLVKYNVELKDGTRPIVKEPLAFLLPEDFNLSVYAREHADQANHTLLIALGKALTDSVLVKVPAAKEGLQRLREAALGFRARSAVGTRIDYQKNNNIPAHEGTYTYTADGRDGSLMIKAEEGWPQMNNRDFFMDNQSYRGMNSTLISHPDRVKRVCIEIVDTCGDTHWMQLALFSKKDLQASYVENIDNGLGMHRSLELESKVIGIKPAENLVDCVAPYSEMDMYTIIAERMKLRKELYVLSGVMKLQEKWRDRRFKREKNSDPKKIVLMNTLLSDAHEPPVKVVFYSSDGLSILHVRFDCKYLEVRQLFSDNASLNPEPARNFFLYLNYPFLLQDLNLTRHVEQQAERKAERDAERKATQPARHAKWEASRVKRDDRDAKQSESLKHYKEPVPPTVEYTREALARRRQATFRSLHPGKDAGSLNQWKPELFYLNDVTADPNNPWVLKLPVDEGDDYYNRLQRMRLEFEHQASKEQEAATGQSFYMYRRKNSEEWKTQKNVHPFRKYLKAHEVAHRAWSRLWEDVIEKGRHEKPRRLWKLMKALDDSDPDEGSEEGGGGNSGDSDPDKRGEESSGDNSEDDGSHEDDVFGDATTIDGATIYTDERGNRYFDAADGQREYGSGSYQVKIRGRTFLRDAKGNYFFEDDRWRRTYIPDPLVVPHFVPAPPEEDQQRFDQVVDRKKAAQAAVPGLTDEEQRALFEAARQHLPVVRYVRESLAEITGYASVHPTPDEIDAFMDFVSAMLLYAKRIRMTKDEHINDRLKLMLTEKRYVEKIELIKEQDSPVATKIVELRMALGLYEGGGLFKRMANERFLLAWACQRALSPETVTRRGPLSGAAESKARIL